MPISFQCSHCQARYRVADTLAGKQVACKNCGRLMSIPTEVDGPDSGLVAAEAVGAADRKKVAEPEILAAARPVDTERVSPHRPTPATGTQPAAADATMSIDSLLAAVRGRIEPVPTTLSYRVAALGVAFLMVLLPLIYVGIILLTLAGVCAYAVYGTAIFESAGQTSGRGGFFLLLLYVGPLLIGVTTVLFMIKPLFARPATSQQGRSLTREQEPKLFAFVDKLCESVHAPRPKRIDIDCEVNASASFRRGLWSLFFSSDLVLTIGMPLAAGLTVRQLGGVLAHEFGHFSQGFGMRISYVVRSISHWFARVVYERDRWDDWLAGTASSIDIRLGIVLHLARLLIWLTRRILWVLMMIGNVLSCYLLRQMEFDADLHETRFSGSDTFRSTSMQLRRLGVAYQQSLADLQGFLLDGKLANDLPELTRLNRNSQEDDLVKKIFASVMEEKTQWLTTHPVDKDRVARAREENEPGVFQLEMPSSVLFEDFGAACEAVTRDLYEQSLGNELKTHMLVPVEQLVSHKAAAKEANLATRRMFGNYFRVPRQMAFPKAFQTPSEPEASVARLHSARQEMIRLLPSYNLSSKQFDEADTRWLTCHQVIALLGTGMTLQQKDFNIPVHSVGAAQATADETRAKLAKIGGDLRELERAFETRAKVAIELLLVPAIRTQLSGEAEHWYGQAQLVCQALQPVQESYADVVKLRNDFAALSLLLRAIGGQQVSQQVVDHVMDYVEKTASGLQKLSDRFGAVMFPFEHAEGQISMTQYLVPKVPAKADASEVASAADRMLEQYHYVYFRCIGTLAEICQRVEEALGLARQPDPPEETEDEDSN